MRDPADAFGQQCIVARLDVAITGFRFGRRHAEQHHLAALGGHGGQGQGALQGFLVFQYVVGGQHQHQLVATLVEQQHRGQGHGRCSVAAERLHQDALGFEAAAIELLIDDEPMVLIADHDRRIHAFEHQAFESLLE